MRKFAFLFIFFNQILFLNLDSCRAESSLAQDMEQMKEQLVMMQEKMNMLEQKVIDQQAQIMQYEASKQLDEKPVAITQSNNRPSNSQWIPDIGVVVDSLFTLDSPKTDGGGADVFNIRELELILGSHVDPYSRLDATVAFSTSDDEPVALEEAYLTRFGLPWDSTARIGKFKPNVGKVMGVHRDALDTVDEPLVIQRYFSEEGFAKTGVDLTKTLDLPIPVTQQVSLGILEGGNVEDEGIFGDVKRRPTLYGHLKNYIDLGDSTGFELGGSYMAGSRDEDSNMEVQVLAADATLTHHFNATQNMKLQGEVFNVKRKESFVDVDEDDGLGGTITVRHDLDGDIIGAYGLADFRVHPMWSLGGRYDIVQPISVELPEDGASKYEKAYSGYLTFYQSEFARWRTQFTHRDLITGKDDNAIYLQATFAIGTHKHKVN